jgi:hypothetical protein
MYVLTGTGEVSLSTDFGSNWTAVGVVTTSDAVDIRSLGLTLYTVSGAGDVAVSTNFGATWTMTGTTSQVHTVSLTQDDDGLVVGTTEGLIAASTDGANWTWVGSINQLKVTSLGNDTPSVTGVGPARQPLVAVVEMDPLWPNPLGSEAGSLNARFRIGGSDVVTMSVYDVAGRLVARRAPESFDAAGEHTIAWDVGRLASGIYFAQLTTQAGFKAHKKLVVVR